MNKKCLVCKEKATYNFSPDVDVGGLYSCNTHEKFVKDAYWVLVFMGEKRFWSMIKSHKDYKNG